MKLSNECKEIEKLSINDDYYNMFKKTAEMVIFYRERRTSSGMKTIYTDFIKR